MRRSTLAFLRRRPSAAVAAAALGLMLGGCETGRQNWALGGAVTAGALAQAPSNELQQVSYLGVFDPDEQLPQMVYRVTIRAQASPMNQMRYGSEWVPAWAVDSINSRVDAGLDPSSTKDKDGKPAAFIKSDRSEEIRGDIQVGRRLIMFGPDGFREAPKDHRLVIVMGATPEKFFQGIDRAIGTVAASQVNSLAAPLQKSLLESDLAHAQRRLELERLRSSTSGAQQ